MRIMARGRKPLIEKRKLKTFRFRKSTIEALKDVAEFLGVEAIEVLELGLNKVFAEVNAEVSSLLSDVGVGN